MIREELKQLSVTRRGLRRFGLLVGGVFLLLGAWFVYRHKLIGRYLLGLGLFLTVAGAIAPLLLRQIYIGWMAMAFALGLVMSTVLLILFFIFVVTPIGWIARLMGQDFLSQKLNPQAPSYWLKKASTPRTQPDDYERQY